MPSYEFATLRLYHTVSVHPDTLVFINHTKGNGPQKQTLSDSLLGKLAELSEEGWQIVHTEMWHPSQGESIHEVWLQRELPSSVELKEL